MGIPGVFKGDASVADIQGVEVDLVVFPIVVHVALLFVYEILGLHGDLACRFQREGLPGDGQCIHVPIFVSLCQHRYLDPNRQLHGLPFLRDVPVLVHVPLHIRVVPFFIEVSSDRHVKTAVKTKARCVLDFILGGCLQDLGDQVGTHDAVELYIEILNFRVTEVRFIFKEL